MRKTSQVSRFRAGLTIVAGLVVLALSAPMAQAEDRGGELKCGNNLPSTVANASATLVWTGPEPPYPDPQVFTCSTTTTTGAETQTVAQPPTANAWTLVITIYGPLTLYDPDGPGPLPLGLYPSFTFSCDPDVGTFDAGGVPHIRFRCVNPNGGGTVTFSLSRNP